MNQRYDCIQQNLNHLTNKHTKTLMKFFDFHSKLLPKSCQREAADVYHAYVTNDTTTVCDT